MRKFVSIILFFAFLFAAVPSVLADENFSFRNGVTFGMTMEDVIASEGAEPTDRDESILLYTDQKAAGEDANIVYQFDGSGLWNIGVIFLDTHTNDNLYIDDFDTIDKSLKNKYGNPATDSAYIWKNDLFKDDSDSYGLAISLGHLSIVSLWDSNTFTIFHIVNGDNYEITHGLLYKSKLHEDTIDTSGI